MLSAVFAMVILRLAMPLPSLALPDARSYELVSPSDKSGGIGGVLPLGSLAFSPEQFGRQLQSSVDGGSISYIGADFYQASYGGIDQYLSQSDSIGWSTQNVTPRTPGSANEAKYVGFSPDLSIGILGTGLGSGLQLGEGAPADYPNLYLVQSGRFQPLLKLVPPHRTTSTFGYAFVQENGEPGISHRLLFAGANTGTNTVRAFSHVLFEANDALSSNVKDGGEHEDNLYEWVEGELRLVNVLPGSGVDPAGEAAPNASFGVDHHDVYRTALPNLSHVISADGSRVFWTDQNNGDLYVREDGKRTVQVDLEVGGGGAFVTASADGSRVFFSKQENLYEYNLSSGLTKDVAPGGVLGLMGASEDGSYVYFVSTSHLVGGATAGEPNLYLSHEGRLSFIRTLSLADNETPNLYGTHAREGDWYRTFAGRTAEVSPNGRYLAFMAKENLTGYEPLAANHERDYEVYVYDAPAERLMCASCNVNGSPPTASTQLPAPVNGVYQQRYLDNGGRLFFSTSDAVLPEDTNGTSDVYEYEEGHVSLISPGSAPDEAVFADASESGDDVFFTTSQQLVPADRDQIVDLYDARVDGRSEAPPAPPCSSEGECRNSPGVAGSFAGPASLTSVGPGNLSAPAAPASGPGKAPGKIIVAKKHRKPAKKRHGKYGRRTKKSAGRPMRSGKK